VDVYELKPGARHTSSSDHGRPKDIARSMSALSARSAVVPGRNAIGIEMRTRNREKVYLRECSRSRNGN